MKTKKQSAAGVGLVVNQGPTREQSASALSAILSIIKDVKDPGVLMKALDVLDHAILTQPVSVQNCHFTVN